MFFVGADALGLLGALVLYFVDRGRGGTLSMIKSTDLVVPPTTPDDVPDYENPFLSTNSTKENK